MNPLRVYRLKDPRWHGRLPGPRPPTTPLSSTSSADPDNLSIISDPSSEIHSATSCHDLVGSFDDHIWELRYDDDNSSSVSVVYANDNVLSGLGLSSGNFLRAVGKAQIRVIEWMWIRYRRALIDRSLKREVGHFKRGSARILDDLIGFCTGCYAYYQLSGWATGHLVRAVECGILQDFEQAVHRAPARIQISVLSYLADYVRNHLYMYGLSSYYSRDDVQNFRNTLKPMATSALQHFNNCAGSMSIDNLSLLCLGGSLPLWIDDASQYTNLLTMPELRPGISNAIEGRLELQYHSRAALQRLLKISNASLGPSHGASLAIQYLLESIPENVDDGACRRASVDAYVRRCSARVSLDPHETFRETSLIRQLETHRRFAEAETVLRLDLRAAYYNSVNGYDSLHMFSLLYRNLKSQEREQEAILCRSLYDMLNPYQWCHRKTRFPKIFRRRRRVTYEVPYEVAEYFEEYFEELFTRFHETNDAFIRDVTSHLDGVSKVFLWQYLGFDVEEELNRGGVADVAEEHETAGTKDSHGACMATIIEEEEDAIQQQQHNGYDARGVEDPDPTLLAMTVTPFRDEVPPFSVDDGMSFGPSNTLPGNGGIGDGSSILSAQYPDESSSVYETADEAFARANLYDYDEESLDDSVRVTEIAEESQQALHDQPGHLQTVDEGTSDEICDTCLLPLPLDDNAILRCCAPGCDAEERQVHLESKSKPNTFLNSITSLASTASEARPQMTTGRGSATGYAKHGQRNELLRSDAGDSPDRCPIKRSCEHP